MGEGTERCEKAVLSLLWWLPCFLLLLGLFVPFLVLLSVLALVGGSFVSRCVLLLASSWLLSSLLLVAPGLLLFAGLSAWGASRLSSVVAFGRSLCRSRSLFLVEFSRFCSRLGFGRGFFCFLLFLFGGVPCFVFSLVCCLSPLLSSALRFLARRWIEFAFAPASVGAFLFSALSLFSLWRCPVFSLLLFVVWFCFVSCLLRRCPSVLAPLPPVWPLPAELPRSAVSGCCLFRSAGGRLLSGGALSARVGRLRRSGVLV